MALDRDQTEWTLLSHASTIQTPVLNWQGAWTSDGIVYQPNDVVENNGSSYTCIVTHIGASDNEPGVGVDSSLYWELLAQSGEDATAIVTLQPYMTTQDVFVEDAAGEIFYRVPDTLNAHDLVGVAAQVWAAGSGGTTDIQVHNVTQAVDMLTTAITIDSGETDSSTAATPPVIDTANSTVATADSIRIDIDAVSSFTAPKGLVVELHFQLNL